MSLRLSKRIYSPSALEFWFDKLSADWEHHFEGEILAKARELYRDGEVREIELRKGDAIIHSQRDKSEYYALIEWTNGTPHVRVSTEDRLLGHSLAAAGMYEIEELVADEIPPVPDESAQTAPAGEAQPATNGNGKHDLAGPNETGEEQAEPEEAAETTAKTADSNGPQEDRSLLVRLNATEQGLVMDALWVPKNGRKVAALTQERKRQTVLTGKERERLIRLTSKVRRSNFEYRHGARNYILRDPARITGFVKNDLPKWRKFFEVQTPSHIETLTKGVREVTVEAEAIGAETGLRFVWKMKMGRKWLKDEHIDILMRRPMQTVVLPGVGLARLAEDQSEILADWRTFIKDSCNGTLPYYMLYSLFGQNRIKVSLTPEAEAWRKELMSEPQAEALPEFLRPYQQRGVNWLAHLCRHGCHPLLADEMGLGKTVQLAALLNHRRVDNLNSLIVCPASVVPVWKNEMERFFPDSRVETLKSGHTFKEVEGRAIWLTSYTQLRRHKALLDDHEFGYAILDEAQQIKNPEAKVTIACMNIRARHRIVLTGTPLENRQQDLWTLFRFLMPGLLGGRRQFVEAFEMNEDDATDKLRRQISPFVLRRTKKDVIKELPQKMVMPLVCPITELQRTEYDRIAKQGVDSFGENINEAVQDRALGLLTLLTRLRQVSCDPGLLPWHDEPDLSHSGKLTTLIDRLLEVIASGHKVVIFSQFVTLLHRARGGLEKAFPDTPILELTGKTLDRAKPVSTFQRTKGPAIILVSLKAGGTGITLHAADYVFLLDPWWNPAVEEQAIDRVHRIGQEKTVFVYRFVTEGTIEERIEKLKQTKRDMFEQVVGGINDMSDFRQHFRSLSDLVALTDTPGD